MISATYMTGFGAAVPERIVTNAELETMVETTDEWIVSRTGIKERHVAGPGQVSSDFAALAAKRAFAATGFTPERVTHILFASSTPDSSTPPSACVLADKIGVRGAFVMDLNAACSGFVNGIEIARSLAVADPYACVLLVAAETLSHRCNWKDRSTCVLFGDGGAAVFVMGQKAGQPKESAMRAVIDDVMYSSDGSLGDLLVIDGGYSGHPYKLGDTVGPEFFVRMQGREVFKHAVRNMAGICHDILERNSLSVADVDLLIPHQANLRIIEAVGERLGISSEKVYLNVQRYGNTSAASIPLALADAIKEGVLRPGMRVLITTFGGGFTWASGLLKF